MARPRKELPNGLRYSAPVKVTSSEFSKPKLGILVGWCKYNDGGFEVWLTGDSTPGHSVYACINPEKGDTIQGIEIARGHTSI
jgi:hypothetical protein